MTTHNRSGFNRRNFLKASAAATVLGALATTTRWNLSVAHAQGDQSQLLSILNYALTLEHLEARAYDVALASGLMSGVARDYFMTFGDHESTHVGTLTSVINDLGGTPVQAQENYAFPQFGSQQEVLEFFHTVEELGAAAYLGQAPRIGGDPYLTVAVAIHNVEGQHAAVLGDLLGLPPSPAFGEPKTMEEVLAVVRPLLQAEMAMPRQMPDTGLGGLSRGTGARLSR